MYNQLQDDSIIPVYVNTTVHDHHYTVNTTTIEEPIDINDVVTPKKDYKTHITIMIITLFVIAVLGLLYFYTHKHN